MSEEAVTRLYNSISSSLKGCNENSRFVTTRDLQRIWSRGLERFLVEIHPNVKEFYEEQEPNDKERIIEGILEDHLKGLSILVRMNWKLWHKLPDLLFIPILDGNDSILNDRKFPYSKDNIPSDLEIDLSDRDNKWMNVQHTILPVEIEERSDNECRSGFPLPFLQKEFIAAGAFGSVFSVEVAPFCFIDKRGNPNYNSRWFAMKIHEQNGDHGRYEENARKEIKNLQTIENSLTKNDHILTHEAIIQHDDKYYIFYEKADMNLKQFLEREDTNEEFCTPAQIFGLFSQFCALSGALDSLHRSIDSNDSKWRACHMDLKPDNVLVFGPSGSRRFKIADFGISKFRLNQDRQEELALSKSGMMPAPTSKTSATRNPGEFQAPEMRIHEKVGRAVDIWSLGCILIVFIIKAFDNATGVAKFHRERIEGGNDYFHHESRVKDVVQRWIDGIPTKYKPHKTLQGFVSHHQDLILSDLQELVKSTVVYDHEKRRTSTQFSEDIDKTSMAMKRRLMASRIRMLRNLGNMDRQPKTGFFTEIITKDDLDDYKCCSADLITMGKRGTRRTISFDTLKEHCYPDIPREKSEKIGRLISDSKHISAMDENLICAFFFVFHLDQQGLINLDETKAEDIDERGPSLFKRFEEFIPCNCRENNQCRVKWNFARRKGYHKIDGDERCKSTGKLTSDRVMKAHISKLAKNWDRLGSSH